MLSNLINLKYINMKRIFCVVFLFINHLLFAQVTVEDIVAVVGDNIILKSDFEQQILQYQAQGLEVDSLMRIQVLEDLLFQKLMLHKAEIDSIEVTEDMVKSELDQRIQYFSAQIGGNEALEEYYGKNVVFILWGSKAKAKMKLINIERHHIITSVHPSPLSAHNGFHGSKPFSKTNEFLRSIGEKEINWSISEE